MKKDCLTLALLCFALSGILCVRFAEAKPTPTPTPAQDENPVVTLKKPVTVAASFTTLRLYAVSFDFDKQLARTAFQSYDATAEKKWTGYVAIVDTDEKGSTVTRSDGKKTTCPVTLSELLAAVAKRGSAFQSAVTQALFASCIDVDLNGQK
jgi:hypothetical protein